MHRSAKIFVAGHRGLVGSAILRRLRELGFDNLLTRTRDELDLTRQEATERFFEQERPEIVFLAAAKVGGILANASYPADFIRENLLIQTLALDAAWRAGTRKLVFLGSSCIYPKLAPQPMLETHLLSGELEPTNECYSVAKIAGIKMAQAYRRQHGFHAISLMPCNLYGPEDNFSLQTSHVIPALMRKFRAARESKAPNVTVWGSGAPRREFLHVDDLADATIFLAQHYDGEEIVNVGSGSDISIRELAEMIRDVTGYDGELEFDLTKPDGTPRKLLDVQRLRTLGWQPRIQLRQGLETTFRWFLEREQELTAADADQPSRP